MSNRERCERAHELIEGPCATRNHLHRWVMVYCGLKVPRHAVCKGHGAPFDYLSHAYFEPAKDLVVWAPRGGGKTRLAAVATMLDLLHKPGVAVRILGGSLEQSLRMWEHLLPDLQETVRDLIVKGTRGRELKLLNGSTAAVLPQSQRAVRGLRVQKLRCDEVEMFDPRVWEAAQLVTKSGIPRRRRGVKASHSANNVAGDAAGTVAGTVEAISTMHNPCGLMDRIVQTAQTHGTRVIKWCLLEVLQRCPPERQCATCPLWEDCGGIAKERCDGFFSIDDAIAMKQRVSVETWESEMMCRRPNASGCVFPSFDPAVHVREEWAAGFGQLAGGDGLLPTADRTLPADLWLALDFGFANPFVCLWISSGEDGKVHVLDEYVQPGRTMDEHLRHIESRQWGKVKRVACDPAGAGRNEQTAESNIALLRRSSYAVKHRASRIVDGIEMIRCALRPAAGEATLFVSPRCERLIKALRSYHYAPGGSELPVKDGEHDHLIDALRYFYVNRAGAGEAIGGRRY